jgi:hypothetical protein
MIDPQNVFANIHLDEIIECGNAIVAPCAKVLSRAAFMIG